MGLFDKLFRPKDVQAADQATAYFKTLSAYTPAFRTRQGSIYEMELTRAAIHAFATHASKLKPEVVGSARADLRNMLPTQTSEWQNTAQFLYRLATILEAETTAFIVPLMAADKVIGYYPILPSSAELKDVGGEAWIKFRFPGESRALSVEFSRVGVLNKYQYIDDIQGGGNAPLDATLDVLDMQRQGMEDAIKQSANIRFLGRLGQTLRPEDIAAERDRFSADNLSADNKSGVILTDAKWADIKQIESNPWVIDAEQMALIKANVFSYLGCNEKILQNEFDEDVWNAFYEGKIEPFALQVSLELTRMTYSPRERVAGNAIMFSSNRLQYAANATKVRVVQQLVDRGVMALEDAAEVFNLPAPPKREGAPEKTYVIRGEYISIDNLPTNTVDNAMNYIKPSAAQGASNDSED